MKTVGIIGGLGPETTSKFYEGIVEELSRQGEKAHPSILIYSVPLPLELERECILEAQNVEKCLPYLIEAAHILEKGGADFLVMPCNSLHLFIEEIRKSVRIPVLSAIDETVNVIKNNNDKHVGLLATSITINNGIYKTPLLKNGIEYAVPDSVEQHLLGAIIYRLVIGRYDNEDKKALDTIIGDLSNQGVNSIILACTDLQILNPHSNKVKILDSMQILLEATVKKMLD